jgi:hypothetical protein
MEAVFNSIIMFLRRKKKTILLVLLVVLITLLLSTTITLLLNRFDNLHVPSIGTIRTIGVEVYGKEINLTQDGKQYIDWGTIYLGTLTSRSFYVRSRSNMDTTLRLNATNWNPSGISDFLTLSWNYTDNTIVKPNQTIPVTITLSADSSQQFVEYLVRNNVREFSFDITIRSSETEASLQTDHWNIQGPSYSLTVVSKRLDKQCQ